MKYPKTFTQKEWSKFSKKEVKADMLGNEYQFINYFTQKKESYETVSTQEILCIKYDITLTDYKTKKEKIFSIIDKVNIKNLNNGIDKFNKGVNQFTKSIESSNKSRPVKLGINQKDYDKLFKSPKKKNSVSFWDEDRKTRKRRNKKRKAVQGRHKPVQKEPDYSALIGKRRVKFF